MIKFLKVKFKPFYLDSIYGTILLLCLTIYCFVFTYIFKPFKLDQIVGQANFLNFCFIASGVVLLVESYFIFLQPKILKNYYLKWTVGNEILVVLFNFIVISGLTSTYLFTFHKNSPFILYNGISYYFIMYIVTGLIPLIVLTLLQYVYHLKTTLNNIISSSENFLRDIKEEEENQIINTSNLLLSKLLICDETEKETLELDPETCIFLESQGNYVELYLFENNKIKKRLIRNSISAIEDQIPSDSIFTRTHRTYIVNLSKVKKFSGSKSVGFSLKFFDLEITANVSKNYTTIFLQKMEKFNQ